MDAPPGNPLLFFKQGLNYHSVPYSNSKELRCGIIIQLIADDFPVSHLPVLRKEALHSPIAVSEHPCVWRHATISHSGDGSDSAYCCHNSHVLLAINSLMQYSCLSDLLQHDLHAHLSRGKYHANTWVLTSNFRRY